MPDRFQRIWALVERIDREPGLGRRQLAEEFSLSERQLQADLIVIRDEMGLPLRRSNGYRFAPRPSGAHELGQQDAILLARLAQAAGEESGIPRPVLEEMMPRLAGAFPARFQPFARAVLSPLATDGSYHAPDILLALVESLIRGNVTRVRLATPGAAGSYQELTITPQLVVPYGESWYLVGYCYERQRDIMVGVHELDPSFVQSA